MKINKLRLKNIKELKLKIIKLKRKQLNLKINFNKNNKQNFFKKIRKKIAIIKTLLTEIKGKN